MRKYHLKQLDALARRAGLLLISALFIGCAGANRPPESGSPRPLSVDYPIKFRVPSERVDAAIAAWTAIAVEQGFPAKPLPQFDSATGTIAALPAVASGGPRLPLVGGGVMTEDVEREALKRFIDTIHPILGTERTQLSLIANEHASSVTNLALYEQRPFRFQIRNGYGRVRITYDASRRVTDLNSTALPELQSVNRDLNDVRASVRPDQVIEALSGQTISWTDNSGAHQLFFSADSPPEIGELVIFPLKSAPDSDYLELHLAWEVRPTDSSLPPFYVDAVTLKVLGGSV